MLQIKFEVKASFIDFHGLFCDIKYMFFEASYVLNKLVVAIQKLTNLLVSPSLQPHCVYTLIKIILNQTFQLVNLHTIERLF